MIQGKIDMDSILANFINPVTEKVKSSKKCFILMFNILKLHQMEENLKEVRTHLSQNAYIKYIYQNYIQVQENSELFQEANTKQILKWLDLNSKSTKTQFIYMVDIIQHLINCLGQKDQDNTQNTKNTKNWLITYLQQNDDVEMMIYQLVIDEHLKQNNVVGQFHQKSQYEVDDLRIRIIEKLDQQMKALKFNHYQLITMVQYELLKQKLMNEDPLNWDTKLKKD